MVVEKGCVDGSFQYFVFAETTPFRLDRLYIILYKTVSYFVFRTTGPLTILVALNVQLVMTLKRRRRIRRRTQQLQSSRRHNSMTMMLIVVVTVFVICQLPDVALRMTAIVHELDQDSQLDYDILLLANSITNMLLAVNSSVNFLIYCLLGTKFRKILCRLILCDSGDMRGRRLTLSTCERMSMASVSVNHPTCAPSAITAASTTAIITTTAASHHPPPSAAAARKVDDVQNCTEVETYLVLDTIDNNLLWYVSMICIYTFNFISSLICIYTFNFISSLICIYTFNFISSLILFCLGYMTFNMFYVWR